MINQLDGALFGESLVIAINMTSLFEYFNQLKTNKEFLLNLFITVDDGTKQKTLKLFSIQEAAIK